MTSKDIFCLSQRGGGEVRYATEHDAVHRTATDYRKLSSPRRIIRKLKFEKYCSRLVSDCVPMTTDNTCPPEHQGSF